jgi:hypothetical protein
MYSGKQIESTVYKVLEKNQHSLQLEYGISGLDNILSHIVV